MTSYQAAVAQLYQLGHELANLPSAKFDLAQVRVLLAAMGDPQRRFRCVLIAGTNGKGSTASTLASILQSAGHRTALYTSPHLVKVNERIRIDGEPISDAEFTRLYERVEETAKRLVAGGELPWHPSFFEMLTAMAFTCFAERQADIAVLEVGMGGRLDATNVVDPLVSVITDVSLDHQKFLGNTIAEIAREKAGIIRPGGIVVTLPQHPEANQTIGNIVLARGAKAVSAVPYVPPVSPGARSASGISVSKSEGGSQSDRVPGSSGCPTLVSPGLGETGWGCSGASTDDPSVRKRYPLDVMGRPILVDSPLAGRHQLRNIALAIATAEQLNGLGITITPQNIESGIRQTRWPGRFQVLPANQNRPETVLDVAHNPAGAWALRSVLSERYGERPLVFVFGVMRDKAMNEIAEILFPLAHQVIAVPANNPRSASTEEIRSVAQRITNQIACEPTVPAGLERAFACAGQSGVVVITGSIYIVGEALAILQPR